MMTINRIGGMEVTTMPVGRKGRALNEHVEKPRPFNGNVVAVGAYLNYLREEMQRDHEGFSRDKLARTIWAETGGLITLSPSTINTIERARQKSFDVAMILELTKRVGGSMEDIHELLLLPFEVTDEGVKESTEAGRNLARRRWSERDKPTNMPAITKDTSDPVVLEDVFAVTKNKDLQAALRQLRKDPEALKLVLRLRDSNP